MHLIYNTKYRRKKRYLFYCYQGGMSEQRYPANPSSGSVTSGGGVISRALALSESLETLAVTSDRDNDFRQTGEAYPRLRPISPKDTNV